MFDSHQVPNQMGAFIGSHYGEYATLDLNEASDRVSLDLVRLLFPEWIIPYLEACRSSSTVLPDGMILPLNKFAPMGSCLCFPVLALTVWAIISAAAPDAHTRERIYVYGDDVIVTTAYAEDAIKQLESFGLLCNRDKSCTRGFFRESCGMDAYKGKDVTPVRLRTVWASSPSPNVYASWIAYANQLWRKRYYSAYDYIVSLLHQIYGEIPAKDMNLTSCPSLEYVAEENRPKRSRISHRFQKKQWRVRCLTSPSVRKEIDGWSMLLRYFAECGNNRQFFSHETEGPSDDFYLEELPFRVRSYTRRKTSMLVYRWR